MNNRVDIVASLTIASLVSSGCMATDGSGVMALESRPIAEAFEDIRVSDGLRVEILVTAEAQPRIEVEADDNIVPIIETRLDEDGVLLISADDIEPTIRPTIRMRMPRLSSASGADSETEIIAESVGFPEAEEDALLSIGLSEGASAAVTGASQRLIAIVTGESLLEASTFTTQFAEIDAQDHANLSIEVIQGLIVRAAGESRVRVRGAPRSVDQTLSDSAELTLE